MRLELGDNAEARRGVGAASGASRPTNIPPSGPCVGAMIVGGRITVPVLHSSSSLLGSTEATGAGVLHGLLVRLSTVPTLGFGLMVDGLL